MLSNHLINELNNIKKMLKDFMNDMKKFIKMLTF